MKNSNENPIHQEFYQHLGRLFYAMAAADQVVRKEEIESLHKMVRKEWLEMDDEVDSFGTDSAFQIEIVFDWMDANKPDAESAYQRFAEYYESHKSLFTPRVKEKILRTTRKIGTSFRDMNKSELIMSAQLENLFKK